MIVTAFSEMGGDIYTMKLHYPNKEYTTPDLIPEEMKVDINYINKLLGLNLKEKNTVRIIES